MKKLLLASCLLLSACDGDWKFSFGPSEVYRNQCHLNPEAVGYSQLGYFEGEEAYKFLSPINIWLDHRGDKPINLDVFTLWWSDRGQQFILVNDCRMVTGLPNELISKALEY